MPLRSDLAANTSEFVVESESRGLRVDTLVRRRWMAIFGQSAAVFGVGLWLGFPLPMLPCLLLIAASALLNAYVKLRFSNKPRLASNVSTLHLGFDILQLSGLLYFTGGMQNPFAFLLLAPVIVSVTSLKPGHTFLLGGLVVVCASILVDFHYPLPWTGNEPLELPALYVIGMWTSLMACLFFVGSYAARVATEARNLSAALTATELVLAREQHLSALDGMAAAAAHELGTPLSTIVVVAKELQRDWPPETPQGADIELLNSQAKRCREILGKLTSLTSESGGPMSVVRLSDMIEEVAEPHRNFGVKIDVSRHGSVDDVQPAPTVLRLPGVLYGLGNLVENAVDFAREAVNITLAWDEEVIIVKIVDDGPGFKEAVVDRLGEPYVTSRQRSSGNRAAIEGGGLGLGIFIAKTLLERTGATLTFANHAGPGSGAAVTIIWPRESIGFEESKPAESGALRNVGTFSPNPG